MDFEIVVVANHHRKALILDHLKDVPHTVSYSLDYNLPDDFKVEDPGWVQPTIPCHTGVYRCFRGHQDAIKKCTSDNILLFEDDAVPNTSDWLQIVQDSLEYLQNFEMVSLHGRDYYKVLFCNYKEIRPGNNFLIMPTKDKPPFICGALAYLLNRKSFEQVLSWNYIGMPIDILLYYKLNFCLLEKSPFNHDRSQGSLIDV
jgi:hypothetical protein